jgi:helicase
MISAGHERFVKAMVELFPSQNEVISSGLLTSGFSCVLQMPTGSGKTWLAEQAIESALQSGSRAVYLTPLRALATELMARWKNLFSYSTVGIFTGDYGKTGSPYPVPFDDARLLVMTPERLDACTRNWRTHWSWLPEVDLLIVDELHLLADRNRGVRLEGAISRFRRLNPFARILGLSATLGNRTELADWLDAVEYNSTWRPVPIQWKILRYRKPSEKQELLSEVVKQNVDLAGKSLVFVQSRRRAEEISQYLKTAGIRAHHHHAGLCYAERNAVESGFRNNDFDALVATSTLEMGINLPVRQVVLYDMQEFNGYDFQLLSTNSVWQRAGRAGRRGLDSQGEVVLLAPSWDQQVNHYERGDFEPIRSHLNAPSSLAEQIVAEVASGLSKSLPQLKSVFNQSLAARQNIKIDVASVFTEMLNAEMLEPVLEEGETLSPERYRATRLGRIAVRHMLSPSTVLLFQKMINSQYEFTFLDLLIIAASAEDCEPVLPVDFEELETLSSSLTLEKSVLLQFSRKEVASLLGVDGKRLLSALKMVLIVRDWTRLSDARKVAENHNCYPFEVERLRESVDRLLLAMSALTTNPDEEETLHYPIEDSVSLHERMKALRCMVVSGLDEFAVTLTMIPGIGPKLAKNLQLAGIADIEDLASDEIENVTTIKGISNKRVSNWIAEAKELIRSKSAYRYKETESTPSFSQSQWSDKVNPYRLRRALELKISGAEGGTYRVIGGLEPHIVRAEDNGFNCDCPDSVESKIRGYDCKHVLAVKLHKGDQTLRELVHQFFNKETDTKLNLSDLWLDNSSLSKRRVSA